jgi:hypothetical protein
LERIVSSVSPSFWQPRQHEVIADQPDLLGILEGIAFGKAPPSFESRSHIRQLCEFGAVPAARMRL